MKQERIITSTTSLAGQPVIRNAEAPVYEILTRLAQSMNPVEVLRQWPGLDLEDVKAALEYAAHIIQQQAKPPFEVDAETTPDQESGELDLKKILVVDDNEANLLLIQATLRNSGFTLSLAADGVEGWAKAQAELPFLIISDIQMPGKSGLQLLMKLKTDERTKNAGVILVTAHRLDSQQVSQGLNLGADDYIIRPFKRDEFLARVGAVIRIKWAEAEARRQARLVVQRNKGLALVNELALAVNSSLDLPEIFASAMQKLSQLLDAEAVSLLLLEENSKLVVNISRRAGAQISTSVQLPPDTSAATLEEQVPAILSNILNDPQLNIGPNLAPTTQAIQYIPMTSKEQVIGVIAIINKRGGDLTETEQVLLHSAAGIIAVAVENAHLLQHAQQQVDDLIVLNEIGHALTSTLDLPQILQQTTRLMQQSLQAEAVSLWLLDEFSHELVLTAASGAGAEIVTGFRLSSRQGIAGYVTQTGEPYISTDLSRDEKYFDSVARLAAYEPRSMLSVPLRVKDKIIGVMQVLHRQVDWFNENHLRLSSSVASAVGIAIENARLFTAEQDFSMHLEQMVAARTSELAAEQEKTEAILASMADGLVVLDAEKRILTANTVAEAMLDFRLRGGADQPISPEQGQQPLWRCLAELTDSLESTVSRAVDVPTAGGTTLSIQAHAAKVRHEDGQLMGTVIVLRDITALKEVERMKARFMAGITHELKTPLSVIKLHSKNLLSYHARLPEQKREELLTSIQSQVKLLEKLIENILELSRLDAGALKIERQPVNLATLIDRIVADLRPLAEEKQIALRWQKPITALTILADPGQIERVVRNLVDNALKYTPAGGSVEVRQEAGVRNDRPAVKMSVIDTGIGIPPAHQRQVFERFYRVDPSHTIPGTGLGLAIVKEIVNAHNGEIHLESVPSQGSTFIVTLPGSESV